jgi:hypothetical protein
MAAAPAPPVPDPKWEFGLLDMISRGLQDTQTYAVMVYEWEKESGMNWNEYKRTRYGL